MRSGVQAELNSCVEYWKLQITIEFTGNHISCYFEHKFTTTVTALVINFNLLPRTGHKCHYWSGALMYPRWKNWAYGTIYYIFLIICYFLLSCCTCVAICESLGGVWWGAEAAVVGARTAALHGCITCLSIGINM